MRVPEDLIKIRVIMEATISLDRERIIEDPIWSNAESYDLTDPEQLQRALFLYLATYIRREQLFGGPDIFMPSTNGPSTINVISMEKISNDAH